MTSRTVPPVFNPGRSGAIAVVTPRDFTSGPVSLPGVLGLYSRPVRHVGVVLFAQNRGHDGANSAVTSTKTTGFGKPKSG